MDIHDLSCVDGAALVDQLWAAKEAERTAKLTKEAVHDELVRRLQPNFEGGEIAGHSRAVAAIRMYRAVVDDVEALRETARSLGLESRIFKVNVNALGSVMKEPSVARSFDNHVRSEPYWQFRVNRATE